jgi:protein BCP1
MGKRRRTHDPPSRAGQAPARDGLAKYNPIDDEPSVSTSSSDDGESSDSGSEPIVSDGGGSDSSPEEDAFDEIDVNFQFFDPRESDFHGLRALLHTYVQDGEFDAGSLADTIIAQVRPAWVVWTQQDHRRDTRSIDSRWYL